MTAYQRLRRRRRRRLSGRPGGQYGHAAGRARRSRPLLVAGGVLLFVVVLGAMVAAGGAAYAASRYDEYVSGVAPPEELISDLPRGGARIYDRNGTLLYEFVDELSGLRRPVKLGEISEWLVQATVATEDASYWGNNGLNLRGIMRAGWENFSPLGGDVFEGSGGSSITQQLAKNVYIPRHERSERSVERKLKEAAIAIELTNKYSKEQILEWYLNSISYGGIYVGVEAAAQGYFGKAANELTLAEAALLAGIPQQPALYDPMLNLNSEGQLTGAAKARQREVLSLMVRAQYLTPEQAERASEERIKFQSARFEIETPHWVLGRVAEEIRARFGERALFDDGLEVITTLDLDLQRKAEEVLEHWISEFEVQSDGHNGALLALDHRTGEILVYVGSRDYFRDDIEGRNDNIVSLNSPGSSLKPFTYMTAFMQGWSTGHGIIDMPTQLLDPSTGQMYTPRNPGTPWQGVIPADKALGNSLNIPAVKAILYAGVPNVVATLKEMGFTSLDSPYGYGPALTLGGVDITLHDLVYGYSVFATGGRMRGQEVTTPAEPGERRLEPVALLKVTDYAGKVLYEFEQPAERQVVGDNFAYLVTSIISDGSNQCITFSVCGALLLPDRPSAQKTGTSEPYEDSRAIGDTWAVGYTPQLVAGVWAGNSDNSPMVNILSTSISWRAWRDFMVAAHEHLDLAPEPFQRPPGVVERELCWPSGKLPTDLCPPTKRYIGLYAEEVLASGGEALLDDWWQRVRVDTRTGLLATASTPAAFVAEEVRLVLPREEVYAEQGGQYTSVWSDLQQWAGAAGLGGMLAPTQESSSEALVRVDSPTAGQQVRGPLVISGRAATPGFERYRVEWGRGTSPSNWVSVSSSNQATVGGVLGTWDTRMVPNGDYTVRVVVSDHERGELRFAIPVQVDNGDEAPDENYAPVAQINAPAAGSQVSGVVDIQGSAVSGRMAGALLEVSHPSDPEQWTPLTVLASPRYESTLATWDTTGLPNGPYTLRLTVRDELMGIVETNVLVTVQN